MASDTGSGEQPPARSDRLLSSGARALALAVPTFRPHLLLFMLVQVVLQGLNAWRGAPWWGLWPLLGFGTLLLLHYLLYKAATVDERWAESRVQDLNVRSYDRSHIENLRRRLAEPERNDDRADVTGQPPKP